MIRVPSNPGPDAVDLLTGKGKRLADVVQAVRPLCAGEPNASKTNRRRGGIEPPPDAGVPARSGTGGVGQGGSPRQSEVHARLAACVVVDATTRCSARDESKTGPSRYFRLMRMAAGVATRFLPPEYSKFLVRARMRRLAVQIRP